MKTENQVFTTRDGHHDRQKSGATSVQRGSRLLDAVTVRCTPQEAYDFWRDFSHFPLFMKEITEVRVAQPHLSHWVVQLPRGPQVEWNAEITHDVPGETIAWQSVGNSSVKQAGTVWFRKAAGGRGTVVSLSLHYSLPGGALTELATKLLGEDPETLVLKNLRRFKAFIETGEVPTVEGQSSGREEEFRKIH